jgi:hypothetical protein
LPPAQSTRVLLLLLLLAAAAAAAKPDLCLTPFYMFASAPARWQQISTQFQLSEQSPLLPSHSAQDRLKPTLTDPSNFSSRVRAKKLPAVWLT